MRKGFVLLISMALVLTLALPVLAADPAPAGDGATAAAGPHAQNRQNGETPAKSRPEREKADCAGLQGRERGNCQHQAAVAWVKLQLSSKSDWMNPNAYANVSQVLYRLEAKLHEEATVDPEAARVAVKEVLQARKAAKQAEAQELDVLAHLQAEAGDQAGAAATLEERVGKNHASRIAYEKLGALYRQLGVGPLQTFVNGKQPKFDVKPFIRNGRTLVPVRAIVEALGAQVSWDAGTRTVTITLGDQKVTLQIGANTVMVNGQPVQIDAAASIEGGRTVVPVRAVSEAFGLHVNWLPEAQMIVITAQPLVDGTTDTQD